MMVASARPREIEIDKPSHTEQLANWISRVRCKKLLCRRNRKRDLRIEAVLTCALSKAEHELRSKQLSRISKWQQFKKQFLKTVNSTDYQNCEFYNNEDMRNSNSYQENNPWQGPLCPELSSLDNFMSKLAEIKSLRLRWHWDGRRELQRCWAYRRIEDPMFSLVSTPFIGL
ncbi:unnamed protein product, partial [Heterotrigona itama]